jgi:threonine/homoserine/homoserine lactone efflux protein
VLLTPKPIADCQSGGGRVKSHFFCGAHLTTYHALLAFTLAAGLLTITPGLDTALVLRTAAVEGPRRAMLAGVGISCGCLTWGLAASVGLGTLLAVSHVAYGILHIAGACYLIFLGAKLLLRKHPSDSAKDDTLSQAVSETAVGASAPRWFIRGLLTNLLNPKVGVFYVTFLPQFIPAGVSVTSFSMLLAAIHAAQGILWFSLLTLATRPISRWLRRPRVTRTLDRTTGAVLVAFGLGLAFDNRR